MSKKKNNQQLGMPQGTAMNRLRKEVMFYLVKKAGMDVCFRCGKRIESSNHLSIEHKSPWLDVDPKLFWDLENIAFSHLRCNIQAHRTDHPKEFIEVRNRAIKAGCRTLSKEFTAWRARKAVAKRDGREFLEPKPQARKG